MAPTTTHRLPARGPAAGDGGRSATTLIVVGVVVLALLAVAGLAALLRGGGDGDDGSPAAATSTPSPSGDSATTSSPSAPAPTSGPVAADPPAAKTVVRTYTGNGNKVLKIKKPGAAVDPVLVTAIYDGSGNFNVFGLDSSGKMGDILVNVVGKYKGTNLLDRQGAQTRRLKIQASGPWTIKIKQTSAARHVSTRAKAPGDDVLLYTGAKGLATFDFKGTLNFNVQYADSSGVLVDEIGRFSGQVPIKAGPVLIEVTADGKWSMQVQP